MTAQKNEIDVKAKVVPVVTSLKSDQKPKTSEIQVPTVLSQFVVGEKVEKEKSQAAKKEVRDSRRFVV